MVTRGEPATGSLKVVYLRKSVLAGGVMRPIIDRWSGSLEAYLNGTMMGVWVMVDRSDRQARAERPTLNAGHGRYAFDWNWLHGSGRDQPRLCNVSSIFHQNFKRCNKYERSCSWICHDSWTPIAIAGCGVIGQWPSPASDCLSDGSLHLSRVCHLRREPASRRSAP